MVAQVSHRAPSGRFIRGYLLTWGLLAAGGLVYLASLAWHPDLFTPSQQTTQPDPSLQAPGQKIASDEASGGSAVADLSYHDQERPRC